MNQAKIYFPGLNGLRFFAAYSVIIHHVEQNKFWAGISNVWGKSLVIDALGHRGVSLFFVISGFLITYLLLSEAKKTNHISIKKFYIRRILRIWPLYYFITFFTFFVFPYMVTLPGISPGHWEHLGIKLFLYLFFFPNLVRQIYPSILGSNQAWSVGIEEQFYLLWPWLIRWFRKNLLSFLIVFIFIKVLLSLILQGLIAYNSEIIGIRYIKFAETALRFMQIEQMAVGAIGAYVYFNQKEKILNFIYHPVTFGLVLGLCLFMLFIKTHAIGFSVIEAVIYTGLILNISTNPKTPVRLETPILRRLGNISYGIYMYHTICLALVMKILIMMNVQNQSLLWFNIFMYTIPGILTLVVSDISYQYFEKYFINLKERFMVVKSSTTG